MTSEQLSLITGSVLSLVFSYVPGLRQAYADLTGEQRRVIMALALLAVTVGVFALGCADVRAAWIPAADCTQAGALALVQAYILALVANQATYSLAGSGARKGSGEQP